mgnify:CR=1 FL=1
MKVKKVFDRFIRRIPSLTSWTEFSAQGFCFVFVFIRNIKVNVALYK